MDSSKFSGFKVWQRMSKPSTPGGKAEEYALNVPALPSNDSNLSACKLLLLTVRKDDPLKINENIFSGLVSMVELKDQFKSVLDRTPGHEISFEGLIDLPRLSVIVATNTLQESEYRAYFLEEGDFKFTLYDAIANARRLTEQNITRWLFQLFTCVSVALQRFITLRHVSLNHITLDSDRSHLHTIHQFNKNFIKYKNGKYMIGKSKMKFSSLDEDARHAWLHLIPSPNEEGFPYDESLYCHVHTSVRAGDRLLRSGQLNRVNSEYKKEELHPNYVVFIRRVQRNYREFGAIAIQLATRTLLTPEEVRRLRIYQYSPPLNKNMANRSSSPLSISTQKRNINIASEAETSTPPPTRNTITDTSSPPQSSRLTTTSSITPRVGVSSREDSLTDMNTFSPLNRSQSFHLDSSRAGGSNSAKFSEREDFNPLRPESRDVNARKSALASIPIIEESETDMLKHIFQDLSRWFPALLLCRAEIRDLISLCFAPMTKFLTLHGTSCNSFPIPYLPRLKTILVNMRSQVENYHRDTLYEPPDIWDEEVLKFREEEKERYQKEMEEKAKKGHERAHRRIQEERYHLWLSMQTEEFRRKREHRKKMQIITKQHQRERDRLIHAALFHAWESEDLIAWLEKAIQQYFQMAVSFREKMDKQDEERKKKVQLARHKHQQELNEERDKERHEMQLMRQRRKREAEEESAAAAAQATIVDTTLHGGINRLLRQQIFQKPLSPGTIGKNNDKEKEEEKKRKQQPNDSSLMYHRVDDVHIKRVLEEVFRPLDAFFVTKLIGTFCSGNSIKQNNAITNSNSENTLHNLSSSPNINSKNKPITNPSQATGKQPANPATFNTATTLTPALQRIQRLKQQKEEKLLLQTDESFRVHQMSQEEKMIYSLQVIAREWPSFFVARTTSFELSQAMIKTMHVVDKQCEDLEKRGKFLVISDEQMFYKRNSMQSSHFQTLLPALRLASFAFCDSMQILDRSRGRQLIACFASACMYQFVKDAQTRLAGELIAADRVRSFFRMIVARKRLYPVIQEKSKVKLKDMGGVSGRGSRFQSMINMSSSSSLAKIASHAIATTRASMIQHKQLEEADKRKLADMKANSSSANLNMDPDFLATLLAKDTEDQGSMSSMELGNRPDGKTQPTKQPPTTPKSHNEMVLHQLLQSQKDLEQQQKHAHQVTQASDRVSILSSRHSMHTMKPPHGTTTTLTSATGSSLTQRPSFLTGGLAQLPGVAASDSAEEFATNRLMMVGFEKDKGLRVSSNASTSSLDAMAKVVEEENDEENEKESGVHSKEEEVEDEDENASLISDLSGLSLEEDGTKAIKTSRKRRRSTLSKVASSESRTSNASMISVRQPMTTTDPARKDSTLSAQQHSSHSDTNKSHYHPHKDSSVLHASSSSSILPDKNIIITENKVCDESLKSSSPKKSTNKHFSLPDIRAPFPALQLSVEDVQGDSLTIKLRILVGTRDYAEDIVTDLESAHTVTVYHPKVHNNNNVFAYTFESLQSSSSGTTPLFISLKSKSQQVYEKYGGFQDIFHRHRQAFVALPIVEQYQISYQRYEPSEQECKLLPPEVVPPHMRSISINKSNSSKCLSNDEASSIASDTGPIVLPLPMYSVEIMMTLVDLHPVHRYELFLTLDPKLSDRLCRFYTPPSNSYLASHISQDGFATSTGGAASSAASSASSSALSSINIVPPAVNGNNASLVKQDHPFRTVNNTKIIHALKSFDALPLSQRLERFMPMIPPPPEAIAVFTPRLPFLTVIDPASASTSADEDINKSRKKNIVSDKEAAMSMIWDYLNDSGHDTTNLIALSFSQSCHTLALRPDAPTPLEVSISYRSLGAPASMMMTTASSEGKDYLRSQSPERSRSLVNVTKKRYTKDRQDSYVDSTVNTTSHLLSFFVGDERPPTKSLRVLCRVSWPSNIQDIPRRTQYEVQRRFVLRPLAQVSEWKEMGLIDDGQDDIEIPSSGMKVDINEDDQEIKLQKLIVEKQQQKEEEEEKREKLQLQRAKKKAAKKAFLGDEDDDESNINKMKNMENDCSSSVIDRVYSRSANQRADGVRPLSSSVIVSNTRYLQERVLFGDWLSLSIVPTTSLQPETHIEDLFSLDADSLLSPSVRSFLQHYIHRNRAVLSGIAPFLSLSSSLTETAQTGWCYAGYEIFVEYRVRVRNSVGESGFARHTVFFKAKNHYQHDPEQQKLMNHATIQQEPFRLASLLLHSAIVSPEDMHHWQLQQKQNRKNVVPLSPSSRRSQSRHHKPLHVVHPVIATVIEEQWHRQEMHRLQQQERLLQEQQKIVEEAKLKRDAELEETLSQRKGFISKEEDPWLKNLAFQSPMFLK